MGHLVQDSLTARVEHRLDDSQRPGTSRGAPAAASSPVWLDALRASGQATWVARQRGWVARPDDVVAALARDGFEEYKREIARSGRDRQAFGGVWQGLNQGSGAVASAVWVNDPGASRVLVFLEIDGEPLVGELDG